MCVVGEAAEGGGEHPPPHRARGQRSPAGVAVHRLHGGGDARDARDHAGVRRGGVLRRQRRQRQQRATIPAGGRQVSLLLFHTLHHLTSFFIFFIY